MKRTMTILLIAASVLTASTTGRTGVALPTLNQFPPFPQPQPLPFCHDQIVCGPWGCHVVTICN